MSIVVSFGLSIVAASKGSAVMNMIYIYAVARAFGFKRNKRVSPGAITAILAFVAVAFGYVFVLSRLLEVPLVTSVNTAVSRFILAADGRALAIDDSVRAIVTSEFHGNLLAELFKGFAIRFASPISVVPLGVAQYAAAFNTDLFAGSNAGLGATILTYYSTAMDLAAIAVALVYAALVCLVSAYSVRTMSHPLSKLLCVSVAFTLGWTFVQDFQAFFVVSVLMTLWLVLSSLCKCAICILPNHQPRLLERR
jgi:hypothetical protein